MNLSMRQFYVRYIGEDSADLRTGGVYLAHDLKDAEQMIGVKDMSGDWYAYPKDLFVVGWATGTIKEVPFWREDMTPEEYDIEREYLYTHWDEYTRGEYTPLWKRQKATAGE